MTSALLRDVTQRIVVISYGRFGTDRLSRYVGKDLYCVRNVVAHGDAREGNWRGNWRMEWVASTVTRPRNVVYPALLTLMRTPPAASSRLNWLPRRFKWTRPFRRKTKCGFCACAIRFRTSSTTISCIMSQKSTNLNTFRFYPQSSSRTSVLYFQAGDNHLYLFSFTIFALAN